MRLGALVGRFECAPAALGTLTFASLGGELRGLWATVARDRPPHPKGALAALEAAGGISTRLVGGGGSRRRADAGRAGVGGGGGSGEWEGGAARGMTGGWGGAARSGNIVARRRTHFAVPSVSGHAAASCGALVPLRAFSTRLGVAVRPSSGPRNAVDPARRASPRLAHRGAVGALRAPLADCTAHPRTPAHAASSGSPRWGGGRGVGRFDCHAGRYIAETRCWCAEA